MNYVRITELEARLAKEKARRLAAEARAEAAEKQLGEWAQRAE